MGLGGITFSGGGGEPEETFRFDGGELDPFAKARTLAMQLRSANRQIYDLLVEVQPLYAETIDILKQYSTELDVEPTVELDPVPASIRDLVAAFDEISIDPNAMLQEFPMGPQTE